MRTEDGCFSLLADDAVNTIALAKVTGFDQVCGIGIRVFQYFLLYQASAATTGIRLSVNHTGTVSSLVANIRWVDASALASTAAPNQAAVGAAGHVMGSFSARAKSTLGWGTTISVDTLGSDMLIIVEGLVIVTASGNLELWHGSEVAATTTIKAGSVLILKQIS